MSKALEYTTEIVSSKMTKTDIRPSKDTGIWVAEFFEQIYTKIKELEDKEDADYDFTPTV